MLLNFSLSVSKNGAVAKVTFGVRGVVSGVCKDQGGVPKPRSGRHRRCHQRGAVLDSRSSGWEPGARAPRACAVVSGPGPGLREADEGGCAWGSADRCPLRQCPGTAPSSPLLLPPLPGSGHICTAQPGRGRSPPARNRAFHSARPEGRGRAGPRTSDSSHPTLLFPRRSQPSLAVREPCPRYWGSRPRCRTPASRWC